MTILDEIIVEKRLEVERMLAENPIQPTNVIERPSLFKVLKESNHIHVIAEMKRASPSKGMIAEGTDPVAQATAYYQSGAACVSVLTDSSFFKGSFADLQAVAEAVPLPLLCKDFMVHPVQIDKAKQSGASIILLIVAALTDDELTNLYAYATNQGLEVLVEVHDTTELQRALAIDAKLIGVNNRDLHTFEVDLARTEEVAAVFPFGEDRVLISESGLIGTEDAMRVARAGVKAVLVGETLMRSGDVQAAIHAMQVRAVGSGK
ncbi:indole-3-glycerol phosphate synthase TrpC [Sporosarcina sp. CAU 1771]